MCASCVRHIFIIIAYLQATSLEGEGAVYFCRQNGVDCLEFMTRSRGCCTAEGLYHGIKGAHNFSLVNKLWEKTVIQILRGFIYEIQN